jgi:hypothetical protein
MKKNSDQFPTCDGCGREIRGEAKSVSLKHGGSQSFHPDAHACASAPEKRSAKTFSKDGAMHTPNYSIADSVNLGYEGNSAKGN